MPTAIIAEDEPILREQLQAKLAKLWPELEVLAAVGDGAAALEALEERAPDFMFLDIRMPEKSGLDVAHALAGRCHVVFVTAYEQYAVEAFEVNAVDYLLKPVDEARLAAAVERLKARLAQAPPDLAGLLEALAARARPEPARFLQWLQVQERDDLLLVGVDELELLQSADKYTLAITPQAEWVIRTPLNELEARLDPDRFWRVHRNAIVRVAAIARVRRDEAGQLTLHLRSGARTVKVSRLHAQRFKQM
jgi:DNA-binding LytR/AlgR family response regulator